MAFFSVISNAFVSGGFWMWVILFLQVASIAIIVERFIFLYKKRRPVQLNFANTFEESIRKGDLESVQSKAKEHKDAHPLSPAILAGVQSALHMGGRHEIQGKMDEVLLKEQALLDRKTGFLSMLANVGTLTGLLGTIAGMIKAFTAIAHAEAMEKATLLSQGIAEAMNTTAYGLIMAIPTLIMFAILSNRANSLTEDLHQGALKIFNWLSYYYDPVQGARGSKSSAS